MVKCGHAGPGSIAPAKSVILWSGTTLAWIPFQERYEITSLIPRPLPPLPEGGVTSEEANETN